MLNNCIILTQTKKNEATLKYNNFVTSAYIGKCGTTYNKVEGDLKTPSGFFNLGLSFGTHKMINANLKINHLQINKNLYWIDDSYSKYYNQLIDINKVKKDWISAEHLIDYPDEYEYAIEIKSNPKNIPNKGSAIFIHCSANKPTAGCIAIEKENMKKLLSLIDVNTKILIRKHKYINI